MSTTTTRLEQAHAGPAPAPVRGDRRRGTPWRGWFATSAVVALVVTAWATVLSAEASPLPPLPELVHRAAGFAGDLLGVGDATPAYRDGDAWARVGGLALDTVVMSVLATGLAALGALATVAGASRSLTVGEFGPGGPLGWAVHLLSRGVHTVTRSVPEVVWALLVVFTLRPGVLAGALALALHEVGVLGRLGADVADSLDRGPLRALRAAGAGRTALLLYGVLPQALPQLVTFLLYRWEVVLRASIVVGFITGAGLGFALRLDLAFRRWTDVALVLATYVLLVWAVDLVSSLLRRLAR
jgi:phosphonate transport system permease protein